LSSLAKDSRELRESTRISFVRVLPGSRLFFTVCDSEGAQAEKGSQADKRRKSQIQQELFFNSCSFAKFAAELLL
jgi:hypothetical protein